MTTPLLLYAYISIRVPNRAISRHDFGTILPAIGRRLPASRVLDGQSSVSLSSYCRETIMLEY